jgi:hypothetical protein
MVAEVYGNCEVVISVWVFSREVKKGLVFFFISRMAMRQVSRRVRWGFVFRGAGPFFTAEELESRFKIRATELYVFKHGECHYGYVRLEKKVRASWWCGVFKAVTLETGSTLDEVFPFDGEGGHSRVRELAECLKETGLSGDDVPDVLTKLVCGEGRKVSRKSMQKKLKSAEERIKELEAMLPNA